MENLGFNVGCLVGSVLGGGAIWIWRRYFGAEFRAYNDGVRQGRRMALEGIEAKHRQAVIDCGVMARTIGPADSRGVAS